MRAYIKGELADKTPTQIIVENNQIGYSIAISLHTYEKLPSEGKPVKILLHEVIKEDGHFLYGFFDDEERKLFRHLLSINGIGPNTARQMLSSLPPAEVKQAIIRGDVTFLKTIKGIGPKSAQRIIVELQDVLTKDAPEDVYSSMSSVSGDKQKVNEAIQAMVALGFVKHLAEKAIFQIMKEPSSDAFTVEQIIKKALKVL